MHQPDYSIDPREVSHYIDVVSNPDVPQLIVGEEAVEPYIRAGRLTIARHLGEFLLDTTTFVPKRRYPTLDADDWALDMYERYGTWLDRLVTPPDKHYTNMTGPLINRAYSLGLGPHIRRITAESRYVSLAGFYKVLGIESVSEDGKYDHMAREQIVDYVEETFKSKARDVETREAFQARARAGQGPSVDVIKSKAGNINAILEERGYPDIPNWSLDDFLQWGATFMMVNGWTPMARNLDYLSRYRRGPSSGVFKKRKDIQFLSTYQLLLQKPYDKLMNRMENMDTEQQVFFSDKSNGISPQFLSRRDSSDLWIKVRMGSQYQLVDRFHPTLSSRKKEQIAGNIGRRDFIVAVLGDQHTNEQLDALKRTARTMGLYDFIWPKHQPDYIRIPDVDRPLRTPQAARLSISSKNEDTPLSPEQEEGATHVDVLAIAHHLSTERFPANEILAMYADIFGDSIRFEDFQEMIASRMSELGVTVAWLAEWYGDGDTPLRRYGIDVSKESQASFVELLQENGFFEPDAEEPPDPEVIDTPKDPTHEETDNKIGDQDIFTIAKALINGTHTMSEIRDMVPDHLKGIKQLAQIQTKIERLLYSCGVDEIAWTRHGAHSSRTHHIDIIASPEVHELLRTETNTDDTDTLTIPANAEPPTPAEMPLVPAVHTEQLEPALLPSLVRNLLLRVIKQPYQSLGILLSLDAELNELCKKDPGKKPQETFRLLTSASQRLLDKSGVKLVWSQTKPNNPTERAAYSITVTEGKEILAQLLGITPDQIQDTPDEIVQPARPQAEEDNPSDEPFSHSRLNVFLDNQQGVNSFTFGDVVKAVFGDHTPRNDRRAALQAWVNLLVRRDQLKAMGTPQRKDQDNRYRVTSSNSLDEILRRHN